MDLGKTPQTQADRAQTTERVKIPKLPSSRDDSPTRRANKEKEQGYVTTMDAERALQTHLYSQHSAQAHRIGTVLRGAHQALAKGNDQESQVILEANEETLRKDYEALFQLGKPNDWLIEEFRFIATTMMYVEKYPVDNRPSALTVRSGNQVFHYDKHSWLIFGRVLQSTPKITGLESPHVSRLMCLVYLPQKQGPPEQRKFVVVDLGSLGGIKTIIRSRPDMPCESSLPGARRMLTFDADETFRLQHGNVTLTFNPCWKCEKNPKTVKTACGHTSVCNSCLATNNHCDTCESAKLKQFFKERETKIILGPKTE